MEVDKIISKLIESRENDFGDYGRTNYIIEKLESGDSLPKSDSQYMNRMINLCTQTHEPETIIEQNPNKDLTKCNLCGIEIDLLEKTIRQNNFWFHDQCFAEIIIPKQDGKIEKNIQIKYPVNKIKTTYPQMIFSGVTLASLIGTTYLLAGDVAAAEIGITGGITFGTIFKSQIISKKNKTAPIIKTGIPGFDSTLAMGLKRNSSIAISGPPGSGKTTFGLQFIYAGAKEFDENGVYISLSQSIDEIKKDCESFGWDIDDLIAKGKILMLDLRPFKIKDQIVGRDDSLYRGEQIPFEHLTKFILNSIKKVKAKRIVIDSISILGMQYSDKFHMRQGMQGMIQSLENFGVTSILISEYLESNAIPLEWFATSGIIQLDNQIINNEMNRTIKITKLRGVEHNSHVHSIQLDTNGLAIYEN